MAFIARTTTYARGASLSGVFDIEIAKAGGVQDGDIMFMFLMTYIATPAAIDSVPNGWTLVTTNATSNSRWYVYYKIASGEGSSYTWSVDKSCRYYAINIAYSSGDFDVAGIDDITAISNTLYGTAGTTVRAASMNVPAANSPLVYFAGIYNTTARTFIPPTNPVDSWSEDTDQGHNTPDISVTIGSLIWNSSGATGDMDVTCSVSITTEKHAFAIALKPPTLTYEASFTGQTKRAIELADSFAGQVLRIVKDGTSFMGQTLRNVEVIIEASYAGQTKRIVHLAGTFSGQSKRIINLWVDFAGQCKRALQTTAGYIGQSIRNIQKVVSFEAATKRIIQSVAGLTGQGERIVNSATSFVGQTLRNVTELIDAYFEGATKRIVKNISSFIGSTKRVIQSSALFNGQSKRSLTTGISFEAQTKREITSGAIFEAQSQRIVTIIAGFIAQTKRAVNYIALYSGQSKRIVSKIIEFAGQTRRNLIEGIYAEFPGVTKRIINLITLLETQTKRYIWSGAGYDGTVKPPFNVIIERPNFEVIAGVNVEEVIIERSSFEVNLGYVKSDIIIYPACLDTDTWAWYDMNVGVIKDGSNRVSGWADRLLSGNDLLQAIGSKQPLYTASGILFDGTDDFLKTGTFTWGQPELLYIVVKALSYAHTDSYFDGDAVYTGWLMQYLSSNRIALKVGASNYGLNLFGVTLGEYSIIRVLISQGLGWVKINAGAPTYKNDFPINSMNGLTLGALSTGGNCGNLEYKEVICRKVIDTETDETNIYNYLANKYGIT